MNKKPNPEMIDDESPEWTKEDFRTAMSFSELQTEMKRRHRGPQKKPVKVSTTIRFDEDIIIALRTTGKGWQTRLNNAVRKLLEEQRL